MIKTTSTVNIKAATWDKSSDDSESTLVSEKSLEVFYSTQIMRTEDTVHLEGELGQDQSSSASDAQALVFLKKDKDSFTVCRNPQAPVNSTNKPDNIWQVVKSVNPSDLSYRGYALSEGDVIKLGKIKLRVRELKSFYQPTEKKCTVCSKSHEHEEIKKTEETSTSKRKASDFIQTCNVEKIPEGGDSICRICLETQEDEENPLITPCNCTGSVRHIHLDCLRQWIESKVYKKDYECNTIYMWKDLECELCHQILPDVFLQDDKEIELLNIVRPTDHYIILETLPEKKQIKKVFYVARFTADNKASLLKVGRKSDCEVKVNDISVSRLHAMLRHFDGVFYLENGFSRFGTLVLFQKEFQLSKQHGLALRIGKTTLNFQVNTVETVVEPEIEEQKSSDQIMNISSESEPEKKVEEENTLKKYLSIENNNLFRKISDASTEMIYTGSDSARLSFSEFPSNLEDQPASAGSAGIQLIDSNQIKNDLEYLDKLLGSIKELLADRSRIVGEIEQVSVPLNRTDADWNSFEPLFTQNNGSTGC